MSKQRATPVAGEFERRVTFAAAWDKRSDDPKKNYGVHGVEVRFVLKGPRGAMQFMFYTNWMLPQNRSAFSVVEKYPFEYWQAPMPADLGYHAYEPQYEGQERMGQCDILTDAVGGCFYDGSTLNAEPVFETLIAEGDEGVWRRLEEMYRARFPDTAVSVSGSSDIEERTTPQ